LVEYKSTDNYVGRPNQSLVYDAESVQTQYNVSITKTTGI